MSGKRLALLVVPVVFLISSALAQVNEVSLTAGRTFVSTQTNQADGLPVHFGNEETVAADYGRLLKTHKIFGIYAELPVAIYFRMDVNTNIGTSPKDISALFATPSVRVNVFSGDTVTPWVSAGGGFGHFRVAPETLYNNPNPGSGSNTGVIQFGAGLDTWFWHTWGARFEARDFYSGVPDLNIDTGRSRQHNYYVGVGVMHRF
jgi:hypothetical protein